MNRYLSKCINYSITPLQGNRHFYLYETTNLSNGHIYIGVRIYRGLNPLNDGYIGNGCGLYKNGTLYKRKGKETNFRRELSKFGYQSFSKKIICFFENVDDMLASEKNIVDLDFIMREDTMNMVEGGGMPPYGIGEDNSNFGRKWTEEQKRDLSNKRKKNGKSKGKRNPKSTPAAIYDLWLGLWYNVDYLHEIQSILPDLSSPSMNKLRNFRYIIVPKEMGCEDLMIYIDEKFQEKYKQTIAIIRYMQEGKSVQQIVGMGYPVIITKRISKHYGKCNSIKK